MGDADDLAGFFLQLTGADSYIDAPLTQLAGGIGTFQLDLPEGVGEGDFEVNYCVYTGAPGAPTLISNVISTGIDVDGAAGDAGSTGLGASTVTVGEESFAGSAYAYLGGSQLFLWMSDGDPAAYIPQDARLFYLVLNAVDGAGTYAVDGQATLAAYLDSRGDAPQLLVADAGTVQIDRLEGRVTGRFDVSGTDLGGGAGTAAGQFDAVLNVGAAPPIPGGTNGGSVAWTQNAVQYRSRIGEQITFACAAGGPTRTVWGTDVYTDDSSICTAGVHAGAITVAGGGSVTIEIRPGQSSYAGSARNGVTSANWGSWGGSFSVEL